MSENKEEEEGGVYSLLTMTLKKPFSSLLAFIGIDIETVLKSIREVG